MKDNVKKFVEAYNTLTKFINEQTVVTKVGEDKNPVTGALLGDASVRALVNTMRSELIASNENGSVRNLAALGITTTKDGTLEIDEKKLDKAISADFEGVASYFTGDTGLAKRLGDKMKPYTDAQGFSTSAPRPCRRPSATSTRRRLIWPSGWRRCRRN